jgi:asparagine N-glycosylation enzyme membrane subunit Stt3
VTDNQAKRERVQGYLRKSRALQARMKVVIAVGVVASLALFAILGPAWGIGFLVLTGIVGGTSFWITAGHIRDFKQTLRDLEDADAAAGAASQPDGA